MSKRMAPLQKAVNQIEGGKENLRKENLSTSVKLYHANRRAAAEVGTKDDIAAYLARVPKPFKAESVADQEDEDVAK